MVESKNGSIIRKHLGYAHIPQKYAPLLNEFHRKYLNPYINYHRPCFFSETLTDEKGKEKKVYPYKNMKTPYEKLKSLPEAASYLKQGVTFEQLDAIAYKISDEVMNTLHKGKAVNGPVEILVFFAGAENSENTLKEGDSACQ